MRSRTDHQIHVQRSSLVGQPPEAGHLLRLAEIPVRDALSIESRHAGRAVPVGLGHEHEQVEPG